MKHEAHEGRGAKGKNIVLSHILSLNFRCIDTLITSWARKPRDGPALCGKIKKTIMNKIEPLNYI
jgi:hypothetical protein